MSLPLAIPLTYRCSLFPPRLHLPITLNSPPNHHVLRRYKAWHAWALNNYEAILYYKLKLANVGSGGSVDDAEGVPSGVEAGDLASNGSSIPSPPGLVRLFNVDRESRFMDIE